MNAGVKSNRLVWALAQLSDRERLLLILLGAVFVPLAVVFFALMPLVEARSAARQQAAEAEAILLWVSAQVRALPAEGVQPEAAPQMAEPIGISAIEQSLIGADLRDQVVDLSNRDDGGVDLAFDGTLFDALTVWLAEMTPVWGYRVAAFRIERETESGLVRASFQLERDQ